MIHGGVSSDVLGENRVELGGGWGELGSVFERGREGLNHVIEIPF